jgi:hypothetical protein
VLQQRRSVQQVLLCHLLGLLLLPGVQGQRQRHRSVLVPPVLVPPVVVVRLVRAFPVVVRQLPLAPQVDYCFPFA